MDFDFAPIILTHLLAITVGVITITILWAFPNKAHKSRKLLSWAFFILTLSLIYATLIQSNYIFKMPFAFKIGSVLCFLFMPLAYLYVRAVLEKNYFKRRDLIHFIPFAIYLINAIPFLLLPYGEQVTLLEALSRGASLEAMAYTFVTIPHEVNSIIYHLAFGAYWLMQVWIIINFIKHGDEDVKSENGDAINWLFFFISVQFFLFYPYFVHSSNPYELSLYAGFSEIGGAMSIILSAGYLFCRPEILYGFTEVLSPVQEAADPAVITEKKEANNNKYAAKFLSEARIIELDSKLTEHIEQNTPYLNQGYNLKDLSDDLEVPLYIISSFINKEKGVNFNDFLNQYRIRFCMEKIKQGEWKNITLEALGYDCGFSNRNSFTSAFKKWAGKTPSEYIKEYK